MPEVKTRCWGSEGLLTSTRQIFTYLKKTEAGLAKTSMMVKCLVVGAWVKGAETISK